VLHLKKGLVDRPDFHGAAWTGRNAQLTDAAFFKIEKDRHLRPLNLKRSGGANRSAGTAMGTDIIVAFDFPGCILDVHTLGFEILDPILEILTRSGEFQHHVTFLTRQDTGIEDIEDQVIIQGQVADQRLLDFGPGKSQDEYFRVHLEPPKELCFYVLMGYIIVKPDTVN
jgi:hypothetical protein